MPLEAIVRSSTYKVRSSQGHLCMMVATREVSSTRSSMVANPEPAVMPREATSVRETVPFTLGLLGIR